MRICLLVSFGWKKTSILLYQPPILWKHPRSKREMGESSLGAPVRKIRFTPRGIKLRLSSILVSNALSLSLALYRSLKFSYEATERMNIF